MPLQGFDLHRALRNIDHESDIDSDSSSGSDSDLSRRSQGAKVNSPVRNKKRKAKSPPVMSFKYVEPSKFRRYLENGRNPILTSDDEVMNDSSCDALSSEDGKNATAVNRDHRRSDNDNLSCISGDENDEFEMVVGKNVQINNTAKQEDFCFFCEHMHQKDIIDTEPIQKLCRAFSDNYGNTDNVKFAKLIHNLYKELIYTPHQHTTTPIPMWRTKTILAHIEDHTEEPKNYIIESLKKYKNLGKTLNKMVFSVDENSGTPMVNIKTIKAMIDVDKIMCSLYAQKIPMMNFCSQKNSTKKPQ